MRRALAIAWVVVWSAGWLVLVAWSYRRAWRAWRRR